ncbi:hypothetical protein DXA13_01480 [Clostridium sp. AM58-1XD]|nr:hypothetical protein DXA13_01480 [Clostridium sp. AM58-1XD]
MKTVKRFIAKGSDSQPCIPCRQADGAFVPFRERPCSYKVLDSWKVKSAPLWTSCPALSNSLLRIGEKFSLQQKLLYKDTV